MEHPTKEEYLACGHKLSARHRQMLTKAHLAMAATILVSFEQLRQYFHPFSGVTSHFHAPSAPEVGHKLVIAQLGMSERQTDAERGRGII